MERYKEHFFGREWVLREIVTGVLASPQPASFSLVASKLAGKSRLLTYLASPDGPLLGEAWEAWRPHRFAEANRMIVIKIDCDDAEAQADLLGHLDDRLTHRLKTVERIPLEQAADGAQPGANRLWQISRQLNQMDYRLVVLIDNFDHVFTSQSLSPASAEGLRPLTRELALVVATEQPLHDLDRNQADSPLFNVMTQLLIGLIEPEAALRWLASYGDDYPALDQLSGDLLKLTGSHPFLLRRVGDILAEAQLVLAPGQTLTAQHLPLIRLRLAEHGRLLFVTLWRNLHHAPTRIDQAILWDLIKRLVAQNLPLDQVPHTHTRTLNWLINQAMVVSDAQGYALFSPLFAEFLANRLAATPPDAPPDALPDAPLPAATTKPAPQPAPQPAPSVADTAIYAHLTKIEGALLRYFQSHPHQIITPEQLLTHVWRRPTASTRRVQEAIRRLRRQLAEATPPVGEIENERGQGYRFIPAPQITPAQVTP